MAIPKTAVGAVEMMRQLKITRDTAVKARTTAMHTWAQFPRFGGTMRHSDSSPPIPPRFVAFARRYHPSTCGSLRRTPGATSTASGVVSRCPRPGGL